MSSWKDLNEAATVSDPVSVCKSEIAEAKKKGEWLWTEQDEFLKTNPKLIKADQTIAFV